MRMDTAYKQLFSTPEMVRDLVLAYVPDPWLRSLDFSTLEKVPSEFITHKRGLRRISDMIWRVKVEGQWVYLYLLLEFQSEVQFHMPVRIMQYMSLMYQDLLAAKVILPNRQLPPILPIVVYCGDTPWNAPTDMADLVPALPPSLSAYNVKLRFWLVDLSQPKPVGAQDNILSAMMEVAHLAGSDKLSQAVAKLKAMLQNQRELLKHVIDGLAAMGKRQSRLDSETWEQLLTGDDDMPHFKMGIEKMLDEKFDQGMTQGLEKGQLHGQSQLFLKLMGMRFGDLPPDVMAKIHQADTTQLERWGARLFQAQSVQGVFATDV